MNRRGLLAHIAALATAAAAYSQPGTFTDLGTHTSPETFTQSVTLTAASDIQWFRIVLPANSATDGYVDIWNTAPGDITDSEIGAYDNSGVLRSSDDDGGPGLFSQLSFGQTAPARPASGAGGDVFSGQDGVLAGGVYWIAVGRFNVTFAAGWTVTSTYAGAERTTTLNFRIQPAGAPIPPSGVGTATPNSGPAPSSFTASVVVTPGANPPSTGLSVTLNASLVGDSAALVLTDPDADNTFTGTVNVSAATAPAAYSLPFTITDAQSRTGGGNIAFTVTPPPPPNDDCGTATPIGLGSTSFDSTSAGNDGLVVCSSSSRDVWFSYTPSNNITVDIDTCDAGTTFDTVLAVFDGCGGTQLDCDDDSCDAPGLASVIEDLSIAANTTVYIRVARFGTAATAGGPGVLTITEVVPPLPPDWDETVNGGGDAGQTPGSVQTVSGSGALDDIAGQIAASGDADVYEIEICDLSLFSATTVNEFTTIDTQLFLFDPATGVGVVMDDDEPDPGLTLQSRLSNAFIPSAGTYYLAISTYDTDPVDGGGAELWLDMPFDTQRVPDGPGAANAWVNFVVGGPSVTGTYRIQLTGACFVGGSPCSCDGDLNGDGVVDIADLALILASFGSSAPSIPTPCADINGDGVVDIADLALFLALFGSSCP
jgi:hypothetical protein